MNFLFYIVLLIYWLTYLFPFAYGRTGYEIEWVLWSAILDNQPTLASLTTVWSLRCLMNALMVAVVGLRLFPVRQWLVQHTDVSFLYQLLVGFTLVLVLYAFFRTPVHWNWGAVLWAASSLLVVLSYYWIPEKTKPSLPQQDLHQHLVPLEEKN